MNFKLSLPLLLALPFILVGDLFNWRTQDPNISLISNQEINGQLESQVNLPAPDFSLRDLDGNLISLKDQKGKVVILDFWATWCGPCIQSFPSMQMVVDRYKNDPNVMFFFINTWEQRQDPRQLVQKFMDRRGFDFKVLMDVKDSNSNQELVVERYGVRGIPAKFIIDGKGDIRYQLMGFSGGDKEETEELVSMIEDVKGE